MKAITFLVSILLFTNTTIAQVGIGTINPEPTSILDIVATNKGILIPRLTVIQRIGINTPAEGLLVYQTDDIKGFYYYDGITWNRILDKSKDGNPIGTIITFPTSNIPVGYLECNGAAISRTTYANLFWVIGTSYGAGDGTTTFNLPDYRGHFLRGYDHGAGIDPDAISRTNRGDGTTGDAVGTKQTDQFSSHHHTVNPPATTTNSAGNHAHTINPPATNTTTNGAHIHTINPPNTATTTNGNHRHSSGFYHKVGNGTSRPRILVGASNTTLYYSAYAGNHNHAVNIPPFNSANSGNHTHTFDIIPFNSVSSGNHTHGVNINPFNSGNIGGSESRSKNITVMYCIKY